MAEHERDDTRQPAPPGDHAASTHATANPSGDQTPLSGDQTPSSGGRGNSSPGQAATSIPRKKRPGCLLWALGVVALCFVMFIVLGLLVFKLSMQKLEEYTVSEPLQLPAVEVDETQRAYLEARFQAFLAALEKGEPARLELSAQDINTLINMYPPFEGQPWTAFVDLEDKLVVASVSVPVTSLFEGTPVSWFGLEQRYLNGRFKLDVSMTQGDLRIFIRDLQMEGQEITREAVNSLSQQNLAEKVEQSQLGGWVRKLKTIRVENNMVIVEG